MHDTPNQPQNTNTSKTSGMAIASLILGISGFFTMGMGSLFGFIIGRNALKEIRNSKGVMDGEKLAKAGIIVSSISFCTILIFAAALILLPVTEPGEKARSTQCQNNLKQQAAAFIQYTSDNSGMMPQDYRCDNVLLNYVKADVFICPLTSNTKNSYCFNKNLSLVSTSIISNPEETLQTFDSLLGSYYGGSERMVFRHSGLCEVSFVDGHVISLKREKLSQYRWGIK